MGDKYPNKKLCRQCGHCCRVIVNIVPFNPSTATWASARGYRLIDSSEDYLAIEIPSVCPHLTSDNKCDMDDKKPETCKQYPQFLRQSELDKLGLKKNRLIGRDCGYCTR